MTGRLGLKLQIDQIIALTHRIPHELLLTREILFRHRYVSLIPRRGTQGERRISQVRPSSAVHVASESSSSAGLSSDT